MWTLDQSNNLKSKDVAWTHLDTWTLSGNTEIKTIKNGTSTLDVTNTEGANFQVEWNPEKAGQDSQEWKQSNYSNGFFTLTNKMTAKVLTAVASSGLDINGM